MGTNNQILFGTLALVFCSGLHIALLTLTVKALGKLGSILPKPPKARHWGVLIAAAFFMIVSSHTMQVWVWAISFMAMSLFSTVSEALYFSLVTYTTLGYGDVTVDVGHRIYSAMAAVTGVLNFGLSTAFLVSFAGRIIPDQYR